MENTLKEATDNTVLEANNLVLAIRKLIHDDYLHVSDYVPSDLIDCLNRFGADVIAECDYRDL